MEVADIFRDHGPGWRAANRGHVSLAQLKVMSATEACRTAALGGHAARCENAARGHPHIAYNSCRIRHYGLLAGPARAGDLDRMRALLAAPAPAAAKAEAHASDRPEQPCPCRGGRMRIIEVFERGCASRYQPRAPAVPRIGTS